jgi:hypothetical protein
MELSARSPFPSARIELLMFMNNCIFSVDLPGKDGVWLELNVCASTSYLAAVVSTSSDCLYVEEERKNSSSFFSRLPSLILCLFERQCRGGGGGRRIAENVVRKRNEVLYACAPPIFSAISSLQ